MAKATIRKRAAARATIGGHRARGEAAPRAFRSSAAFREWLEANHARVAVLWIRCFKKHASHRGVSYRQALDEALCFGWIDGVVASIDEDSYAVRFTPRKAKSIWSRVNIKRMQELLAEGRVALPGKRAFEAREDARSGVYSFEREAPVLSPLLEDRFKANRRAWEAFNAEPPGYRRICLFWIMSAKQEATRLRRLDIAIDCAARGVRIPLLQPSSASKQTAKSSRGRRPR